MTTTSVDHPSVKDQNTKSDGSSGSPSLGSRLARVTQGGNSALALAARWGVVGACILTGVVFYILKPHVFSDLTTWKGILNQSALPAIVAMGLTVALIVGDFDLSIGAVIGLAMGVSISLMTKNHMGWVEASIITILIGAFIGVINGGLVAGLRVNSFIGTLAASSVIIGIEAKITGSQTITQGIPSTFSTLGGSNWLFGLTTIFWIAVILGVTLWLVTAQTEWGRYMFAVGGNAEAARLAGVRNRRLRVIGFVIAGSSAALAGVLLAAQSAGYYPNAGTGFLLPAFAAAFLGTAAAGGKFAIGATAFAVFFLQMLQTGLTVLNVETWVVNVVQGLVLAIAVVIGSAEAKARVARRRASDKGTQPGQQSSATTPAEAGS
jgi:ribose transport system permease protein